MLVDLVISNDVYLMAIGEPPDLKVFRVTKDTYDEFVGIISKLLNDIKNEELSELSEGPSVGL